MSTRPDVIVVGAGFAGVAAATALAERGAKVLILETRQRVGGRAASWTDPRTGEVLDNGQHVLGAFYEETLRLLDRLGTREALEIDPTLRIRFWERGHGEFELAAPNLPAPFHWLAAVGGCARLTVGGRLAALTLHPKMKALLATPEAAGALTVERMLTGGTDGIPEDLAQLLRPLAVASLNEDTKEGSALLFAKVMDQLLAAPADESGLALARRGLGDLFAGLQGYLEARGSSVRFRATALGVRVEGSRAVGVSLLGGERLEAGAVVLAVPHERFGWMLRPEFLAPYREIVAVPWAPIVSTVHVFDRAILPSRFVGLLGTATQWAFDRGAHGEDGGHAVGTIRSGAFHDATREAGAIAEETTAELREAFPAAREARVLSARVFKERRATIRSTPAVQPLRPGPRTAIEGLVIAGDWTDTGLPATIESAVVSGHRAAAAFR